MVDTSTAPLVEVIGHLALAFEVSALVGLERGKASPERPSPGVGRSRWSRSTVRSWRRSSSPSSARW